MGRLTLPAAPIPRTSPESYRAERENLLNGDWDLSPGKNKSHTVRKLPERSDNNYLKWLATRRSEDERRLTSLAIRSDD